METDAGELFRRADALCELGQYERSIATAREVLAADPDCPYTYSLLTYTLGLAHRDDEAVAAAERLVALEPTWAAAHAQWSDALVAVGRMGEAVAAAAEGLRLDPAETRAAWAMASVCHRVGSYDRGVDAARLGLAVDPSHVYLRLHLAINLAGGGAAAEAVGLLDGCVREGRNPTACLAAAGWAHWHLQRLDDAADLFLRSLAANPMPAWTHEGLARVRLAQGRRAEALQHYRAAGRGVLRAAAVARSLRAAERNLREADALGIGAVGRTHVRRRRWPADRANG